MRYAMDGLLARLAVPLLGALLTTLFSGCAETPVAPTGIAVSASQPLAAQAGLRALEQGGNAFDAAIAMAAVLAVTEPYDAGLGGGSFFLLRDEEGRLHFVDAGAGMPGSRHPPSRANQGGGRKGAKAAVPGTPAAWLYLSRHFAERPLEADLADAIRLAQSGFQPGPRYRRLAAERLRLLRRSAPGFLDRGRVPAKGFRLRQPALARSLRQLAAEQDNAFYRGEGAQHLQAAVQRLGVRWASGDLTGYRVKTPPPLRITLKKARLIVAPSPHSYGPLLAQMTALAKKTPVAPESDRISRIHHLAAIMRLSRADLSQHPDIPVKQLLTPLHLQFLGSQIDPLGARVLSTDVPVCNGISTTFSVIDARGNAVVATSTLNRPFGSGLMVPGSGIVLNDALAADSGPCFAPMTPAILETPGKTLFAGTGGGQGALDALFLTLESVLQGAPVSEAVAAPRFTTRVSPPSIRFEPGSLDREAIFQLQSLGYAVHSAGRPLGRINWVSSDGSGHQPEPGTDPRGRGQALRETLGN